MNTNVTRYGYLSFGCVFAASLLFGPVTVAAEETASSIARGGRLYDKWWAVNGMEKPEVANPAYPAEGKYYGDGGADWRCKECHGWDYKGKDGVYGEGGHATGIKGINAAANMDPNEIAAVLRDDTHGYTDAILTEQDVGDLALFVSQGQLDMDQYIDRSAKTVGEGDAARGEPIFNTICAKCHGVDGARDEEGEPISGDREALGHVAQDNPWEALHKIRHGQPDENMPSLLALDLQIALDLLAHMQTLPEEAE